MKLANDVARCDGREDWANGVMPCKDCARRIAPRPEYVWIMSAPEFVDSKCPERIENET